MSRQANRLIHEPSPYLQQHARNPVDWYPWGDEAFASARAEDKPIFLSIGYATCHWCHVMERESFEDEDIAALMRAIVIAVKVDREERPDLDALYMSFCQAMTGRGGWPLTVFLTPDGQPFFAGTYFPKESGYGRTGMRELLQRVHMAWKSNRQAVIGNAAQILAAVRER
ncbi:MAG TPA: thioredoxin domain-containing protein, partial [Solidesulfovibrio sp.]|nr:thioredoxin domain-containing protein [Solidesulfovibrio sp.]